MRIRSAMSVAAGVLISVFPGLPESAIGQEVDVNNGKSWLSVTNAAEGGRPVVHGGAWRFRKMLKALAVNQGELSSPAVQITRLKSSYPWSVYEMGEDRRWTGFLVVSDNPEKAVGRLMSLFEALSAVPFVPKPEGNNINTVFVSDYSSLVFFNGYGISPLAAKISPSGEEIELLRPALSLEGEVVPPGPMSGPTERFSVGTGEVFLLTKDAEGRGMAESQRPRPSRSTLIAWDGELSQLPPFPYDEVGTDDGLFWIQRNVNSFEVPGGHESPFFATSVHCAHYNYQYSLLNPISGQPSVVIEKLEFAADGPSVRPIRVLLDIEPATDFRGKAISCRSFTSKNEILDSRFGFYKGEFETNDNESKSGEAYFAVSNAFSLKYFRELRERILNLNSPAVVLSTRIKLIIDDPRGSVNDNASQSDIDRTEVMEMGGSSPGLYLSALSAD